MADAELDPSKMKVNELKEALRERGLSTTGVKATLQARLEEALAGGSKEDDDDEGEKGEKEEEEKVGTKRKAPPRRSARKAKKAIEEDEEEDEDEKEEEDSDEDDDEKEEEEPPKKKSKGNAKVDPRCRLGSAEVVEDYDCMLNQTNISQNNNKFYVIQLLKSGSTYYLYTRWGRVGENGQNACKPQGSKDSGISAFKKQFKSKTANDWDNRAKFKAKSGKYTLIEIEHGDEEEVEEIEEALAKIEGPVRLKKDTHLPCTLPSATQSLIKLIFDHDMFKQTMVNFNIDVKKMPLGKLSKSQIAKGHDVLEKIEDALNNGRGNLAELTSKFYTLIPHNFGRNRPPVFRDLEDIQKKRDMLNVLADIEVAQSLEGKKKEDTPSEGIPHPYDVSYKLLNSDVEPVGKDEEEYKIIYNYLKATEGSYQKLEIEDLFRVRRHGEESRFAEHDDIAHRKLLWHGTNVAVVVAILSSGLRIMPHSGGRVGKGIYFASENAKSAGYVGRAGNTGIMFLSEVALGKEHHIKRDDCTLRAPPAGYDSIVARGHTEPDPSKDTVLKIDGKDVIVPQGQPIRMPDTQDSSFSHSEYLIYKESQNRIRYMLRLKWPY